MGNSLKAFVRYLRCRLLGYCTLKILTLNVTDRCNMKCLMCDIWRKNDKKDMEKSLISKILDDGVVGNLECVCITGGEPFVRDDLPDIVRMIIGKVPGKRIIISTNGLLKDRVLYLLASVPRRSIDIHVSLDGTTLHDYVRGTNGALSAAISTIKEIRKRFPEVNIETKMTVAPWNHHEIMEVFRLSRELGTRFAVKLVQNNIHYTNSVGPLSRRHWFVFNEGDMKSIMRRIGILRDNAMRERRIIDALYLSTAHGHLKSCLNRGRAQRMPICKAIYDSLFIMPDGNAYTCRKMNGVGNAYTQTLSDIWKSAEIRRPRNAHKTGRCPDCMSLYGFYG